jgi:hypothetical protein
MSPIRLTQLTFSDGTIVPLEPDSVVVLVGSNNVGKSRALRDINEWCGQLSQPMTVVTEVGLERTATTEDAIRHWLGEHAYTVVRAGIEMVGRPAAGELQLNQVVALFLHGPPFRESGPFFVLFANTEQRLQIAQSVGGFDALMQPPTAPFHVLYIDAGLERRLSDAAERAFDTPLIVNRASGATIHVHTGRVGDVGEHSATNEAYRQALSSLPVVQGEGDGIRSYVGVLLSATAARYPVVLIDEPEAFLHPPQARQLGRELVTMVAEETQLIAGTHSAEFLEGVLESASGNVTVIRLDRRHNVNYASVLPRQSLAELWSDPLLRYSGLLDGLFHRGVVICESDADCRYYEAVLDASREDGEGRPHDLMFTHTGGKHRISTAVRAMRAIGVPVRVIADFDVLREAETLRRIVESLGGGWDALETQRKVVVAAVEQLGKAPPLLAVKEEVAEILEKAEGAVISREDATAIRNALKVESGWDRTRLAGVSGLPQGDAAQAATRLLADLKSLGLHVVPVGELERWAPNVPHHGPRWVSAALEANAHRDNAPATEFITEVAAGLDSRSAGDNE